MSELSHIDINNVDYNIKDAQSRNNINSLLAVSVVSGSYNSTNHTIELKNSSNVVVSTIPADAFIKDGMVNSVEISNGNLVITFNADAGKSPISIPLTDIFDPSNYYNRSDIDGYLASLVATGSYNSTNHTIELKNASNVVLATIPADAFIKDGMVSDVSIVNENLVITFNTDSGKSPISIPLTSIFNPSNYYQKSEIDSKLAEKQSEISNLESKIGYYECSSEASSASKTIAASNYVLGNGGSIKVKMTNANTADNATLNINSTGAKPLYYGGVRASSSNSWEAGETVEVYYDGTSYYANNVAGSGGDGAFDVSAKYPTSGVEGGNTYTLDGALAVLDANLPADKKEGGMEIKFVSSSDNKYVKFFCTANSFTTDVTQWQGVDDEPTAGSDNLARSGGVAYAIGKLSYSHEFTAEGSWRLGFDFENGKDYLIINKSNSISFNLYNNGTLITTITTNSQYLYHADADGYAYIYANTGTANFEITCNIEKRLKDAENNIEALQADNSKVFNHVLESHTYTVTSGTGSSVNGDNSLVENQHYLLLFKQGRELITRLTIFNTSYNKYVVIKSTSEKVEFVSPFSGAFKLEITSSQVIGTGTLQYDIIDKFDTLENEIDDNKRSIDDNKRSIDTLDDSKANAVKSKNLLNPNTLYTGHFYWSYGNETAIGDNANHAITDFIPVNGQNIKANWTLPSGMANCVFDANKAFLRKITTNDYEYQSGDAYVRYTTVSNPKNRQYQLEYGSSSTPYEPYTDKLDVYQLSKEYTDKEIDKLKSVDIVVKQDGTGDYTSVVEAVNYANSLSSDGVVRNIHIYSGIYDIFDELGGQTWLDNHTTMYGLDGLFPKNNVNLIGHGLVILKTILPTTINESQGNAISALSLSHYNNRIENIVVIGQNTRYCCHDESDGHADYVERVVENCTFILLQRTAEHAWPYMTAYGAGTTVGGGTYDFKNCRFMSSTGNAWSFHTNNNAKPMYFNVDGCFGYCSGSLSFRAAYYGTNQVGTTFFNIKNCTGNGSVGKRAETEQSTDHIVLFNNGYESITTEAATAIYNQIIDSLGLE